MFVGYWLYPQLNPIEVIVEKSLGKPAQTVVEKPQSKPQKTLGDESALITENAQEVNTQSIPVGDNTLPSNKKTPAEVLVDSRLKRLKTETLKVKRDDDNLIATGRESLKAIGKVDDFSNFEETLSALKWKEAGEAFTDGSEYEQWAQDMHRNITEFIQNSELAYDIYIERVNCNSQGCEVVGKDDATKSWTRIVWSMQGQQWWTLKGTGNRSNEVTREGEGYFYYKFSRY
ncbi:MAG: hypothetical protein HRT35_05575 [Algicola sp.]|nr:hypothetical protein [Algicola sp.]